eukprot:COSAG05_NODE_1270_length_5316_cov_3.177688_2_plen_85_part_00
MSSVLSEDLNNITLEEINIINTGDGSLATDGLETGAPAFQWVKYSDMFGQNHKKILKHVGKKARLPDGPPPNYLRRPSIYGCVR